MEQYPNNRPEVVEEKIEKRPSTGLKIIVLICLIVLLTVGLILPIKLAPNAFLTINSWFSRSKAVSLTADKTSVLPGEQLILSWNGDKRTDGSYILNYSCTGDVQLETSVLEPNETVPCSSDYYFAPSNNSIALRAQSRNNQTEDVPVTLSFQENGTASTTVIASTVVTVLSSNGAVVATSTPPVAVVAPEEIEPEPIATSTPESTPVKPVPAKTPVVKKPLVSNPNGNSDLKITILSQGVLDDDANYTITNYIRANSRGAIKFVVTNIGDKNSGSWSFDASLPSSSHPTYSAYNLSTIAPGNSIIFTLGFDDVNASSQNIVTITVKGDNVTSNNTASKNLGASY